MSTEQHAPKAAAPQTAQPAAPKPQAPTRPTAVPPTKRAFIFGGLASAALAACGGGGGDTPAPPVGVTPTPTPTASPTPGGTPSPSPTPTAAPSPTPSPTPSPPPTGSKPTAEQAARFLNQAAFGATMQEIDALTNSSFTAWFDTQTASTQTLHVPEVEKALAQVLPGTPSTQIYLVRSLWKLFATGQDQLRQRASYALSQIFVISTTSTVRRFPTGPASYMDMLGTNAFGNYRKLLEDVALHPMMGIYLTHLRNQKEDPATGRAPDENFAREIMQLFSIGLYQLNLDGTLKLNASGKPVETYTNADISGLAKVFTGLSWAGPDTSSQRFRSYPADGRDLVAERSPMQFYPQFHSISEKKFLGVTIPASATPDGASDLKTALDTLFNHPNVGPFIGKQLIQRLVTSNPSPAYVARVATAFNENGKGERGDLKAVFKAILLDQEAREATAQPDRSGKLREPAVRFVQWMRAFKATSASGVFSQGLTLNPATQLTQSPLAAPSVFNFYRPGYVPPNSKSGAASLVLPEAQITNETSVAGYLNFMRGVIAQGAGNAGTGGVRDIQADYTAELALAGNPQALVDRLNLLLASNALSDATRTLIRDAVTSVQVDPAAPDAGNLNRVKLAIYMTMAAPEYLVQN